MAAAARVEPDRSRTRQKMAPAIVIRRMWRQDHAYWGPCKAAKTAEVIRIPAAGPMERARSGGQLLVVMPPTGLDDLVAVTGKKERMPQKSTFFYPKLLSGLVFYDHGSVS